MWITAVLISCERIFEDRMANVGTFWRGTAKYSSVKASQSILRLSMQCSEALWPFGTIV